jgi:hypothetical protein
MAVLEPAQRQLLHRLSRYPEPERALDSEIWDVWHGKLPCLREPHQSCFLLLYFFEQGFLHLLF